MSLREDTLNSVKGFKTSTQHSVDTALFWKTISSTDEASCMRGETSSSASGSAVCHFFVFVN